jgi:hypothetical protein
LETCGQRASEDIKHALGPQAVHPKALHLRFPDKALSSPYQPVPSLNSKV